MRVGVVACLMSLAVTWSSPPAQACFCVRHEPNLIFEGVAISVQRGGFADKWTIDVIDAIGRVRDDPITVNVNSRGSTSCGLEFGPRVGQRYRFEARDDNDDAYPPSIGCSGTLEPLSAGEVAFPTPSFSDSNAGWPAMVAALFSFGTLIALAVLVRRRPTTVDG